MNTTTESPDVPTEKDTPSVQAGTTLYYSLIYVEPAARLRAIDTLAFLHTISTTLYDVTEPQVAEKKIHWWHEELARLAKQSARHPACIAVQNYLNTSELIEASLNVLSAAATERYSPIATDNDLREHIVGDYRARLTLFDHALRAQNNETSTTDRKSTDTSSGTQTIIFQSKSTLAATEKKALAHDTVALGLGRFLRLSSLVERLRRGYPVFSDECYAKYSLRPDDLLAPSTDNAEKSTASKNNINNLLSFAIDETHSALEDAKHCIADNDALTSVNLPVQIMCHIRSKQLKLWQKQLPNLLNESVSLTPLRKFFIAYGCKRRFIKAT